jgi:hypothetical protein
MLKLNLLFPSLTVTLNGMLPTHRYFGGIFGARFATFSGGW